MQHIGRAFRATRNLTRGYSDTQVKVREATSNNPPGGPSSAQMHEIAQMTFESGELSELLDILFERLDDGGKNWRRVLKSLTVIAYCIQQGSDSAVTYFRDSTSKIRSLVSFQFIDEDGSDRGASIRQKAEDIVSLLTDEARLWEERHPRRRGIRLPGMRRNTGGSQPRSPVEERRRYRVVMQAPEEDGGLHQAIQLSRQDEARRRELIKKSNPSVFFDDLAQMPSSRTSATPSTSTLPSTSSNSFTDPALHAARFQPQLTEPQFVQQRIEQEAAQAEYLRRQQQFLLQLQQEPQGPQQLQQLHRPLPLPPMSPPPYTRHPMSENP